MDEAISGDSSPCTVVVLVDISEKLVKICAMWVNEASNVTCERVDNGRSNLQKSVNQYGARRSRRGNWYLSNILILHVKKTKEIDPVKAYAR